MKKHALRSIDRRIGIDAETQSQIILAAKNVERVSGLTHNFYRYPARFSPKLVRAAIAAFSAPGDLVLDPFMGGGTTLVEALALGRNSIGSDLNELALFIAHVKTRIYTEQDLACITAWLQRLPTKLTIAKKISSSKSTNTNYTKHLNSKSRWRIRKAIQLAIDSVSFLPSEKLQGFAKCVIDRKSVV